MTDADCPLNPLGHKYFLFQTKTDYELMEYIIDDGITARTVAQHEFVKRLPPLYQKIEYAILSCNCSAVVRVRVRKQ